MYFDVCLIVRSRHFRSIIVTFDSFFNKFWNAIKKNKKWQNRWEKKWWWKVNFSVFVTIVKKSNNRTKQRANESKNVVILIHQIDDAMIVNKCVEREMNYDNDDDTYFDHDDDRWIHVNRIFTLFVWRFRWCESNDNNEIVMNQTMIVLFKWSK